MINELSVYVEPEVIGEDNSPIEMQLYAELSGWKSTPEQIDKPADTRLKSAVQKAKVEEGEPVAAQAAAPSSTRSTIQLSNWAAERGFTITDMILLLIAGLLLLNIITR